MNIDESIWGAKDTWRSALVTPITIDEYDVDSQRLKAVEKANIKISTENFTVRDAIDSDTLSKTEDFDPSVSFWNVGGGASFLSMKFITYYTDNEYYPDPNEFTDISFCTTYTSNLNLTEQTYDDVPLFITCKTVELSNNYPTLSTEWNEDYGENYPDFKKPQRYRHIVDGNEYATNEFVPNIFDTWCVRPEYNLSDQINDIEPDFDNYSMIAPVMDFDYSRVVAVPRLMFDDAYEIPLDSGLNFYNILHPMLDTLSGESIRNTHRICRLTVNLVCTKADDVDYEADENALGIHLIETSHFGASNALYIDKEDHEAGNKIYVFDKQDATPEENYTTVPYGQSIIPLAIADGSSIVIGGMYDYDPWYEDGYYIDSSGVGTDLYENARTTRYARYPVPYVTSDSYYETNIDTPMVGYVDGVHWKSEIWHDDNVRHLRVYLDVNSFDPEHNMTDYQLCDAVIEWIREQTAYLGFQFTDSGHNGGFRSNPSTGVLPVGWFMPKFDFTNGAVTTGEYTHNPESDLENYPNALWTNNLRDTIPAPTPPEPPTPPDPDEDSGDLDSTITHSTVTSSVKYFKLEGADLISLSNKLNGGYVISGGNTLAEQLETDFKGTNPYDYINSVVWFPFEVTATAVSANIVMGAYDSGINKHVIEINNSTAVLDFGTHVVKRQFRDFRDFAPYTKLQLDVPFCGKIELDTKVFMGHTLGVKLFYDVTNGACTALIYRDNLIYQTLDGRCGVQIPMTAVNMAQYQNQIAQLENAVKQNQLSKDYSVTQGALNYFGSWAKFGASLGSGVTFKHGTYDLVDSRFFSKPIKMQQRWTTYEPDLNAVGSSGGGILNSMNNLAYQKDAHDYKSEILDYSMSHTAPTASAIGSSDPINNLVCDYRCRLLYIRCKLLDNYIHDGAEDFSIYKSTIGFATIKSNTIGENRGFTIATNVRLDGVPATTREKDLINSALLNGIIINIADNNNT